jgi:YcaO cyclodehydratase, ATP-ad Mg2+-binding
VAAYGSIVVDPRLLVDENGTYLGPREGDATRLLGSVRGGSVDAFVRATDLTDGRERLLPARQAFPVLRTPRPSRTPCGTSAALDWREALTHGLLQHCVRLTVSGSSYQARQPTALAAEDFDQDPAVRFLATMVKAAGIDLTLHDITGPAGVPVVACASTSGETVYGGGVHLVEAVREALTAALFRYQLRCDPVLKAAISTATSAIWTNPASSASLNPDRLVHALMGLGCTPSVFALDHDRAVHEAFPYVLRVIIEQRVAD